MTDLEIKLPPMPHSPDAELAVLGACMLEQDAIETALSILPTPEAFYVSQHGIIYQGITNLYRSGTPADIVTLVNALKGVPGLGTVSETRVLLSEVVMRTPTAANVQHHCRLVYQDWLARRIALQALETLQGVFRVGFDPFDAASEAEGAFSAMLDMRRTTVVGYSDLYLPAEEDYLARMDRQRRGIPAGVVTGLLDLDKATGGYKNGDFIIQAGRPSMGKTAMMMSQAEGIARNSGAVGVIELEMTATGLFDRGVAREAKIDSMGLINGSLPDLDWVAANNALHVLKDVPVYICDSVGLKLADIRSIAKRLVREKKIIALFIDYLQLITPDDSRAPREQQVSRISNGLKRLAKELAIPVIALSQLNRSVEGRPDKRPTLSDLRESGSLEQDADLVMLIHRPEYYGIMLDEDGYGTEGIGEILIDKFRQGATGKVRLQFEKKYAAFENLASWQANQTYVNPALASIVNSYSQP